MKLSIPAGVLPERTRPTPEQKFRWKIDHIQRRCDAIAQSTASINYELDELKTDFKELRRLLKSLPNLGDHQNDTV